MRNRRVVTTGSNPGTSQSAVRGDSAQPEVSRTNEEMGQQPAAIAEELSLRQVL